jgi:hypothetical protein
MTIHLRQEHTYVTHNADTVDPYTRQRGYILNNIKYSTMSDDLKEVMLDKINELKMNGPIPGTYVINDANLHTNDGQVSIAPYFREGASQTATVSMMTSLINPHNPFPDTVTFEVILGAMRAGKSRRKKSKQSRKVHLHKKRV